NRCYRNMSASQPPGRDRRRHANTINIACVLYGTSLYLSIRVPNSLQKGTRQSPGRQRRHWKWMQQLLKNQAVEQVILRERLARALREPGFITAILYAC
ncbi:MAG: hypothetical protein M0Q95_14110, partial [Porticoccaceae bacterium]|nr:hypothetical protein [Porticoccaceae bacterium]